MKSDQTADPWMPAKRVLLGALAVFYIFLAVVWVSSRTGRPIFGLGEVEYWGRMAEPLATAPFMTWKIVPSMEPNAVKHFIDPPVAASEFKRLDVLESNDKATLYRATYLSDSQLVYGVLGVPKGIGPWPAMLVCHPSDSPYTTGFHTRDTVKFLAELGVYTYSTDYRGWGPSQGARGNEVRDIWSALATLRADAMVKKDRLGMIGFSMGGGLAARAAAADTNLALLALYYPQMFGSIDELRAALQFNELAPGQGGIKRIVEEGRSVGADDAELEYALRMISPIYHLRDFPGHVGIFHGDLDVVISPRQSRALNAEMQRLGKRTTYKTYSKEGHAFANSIENPSKSDLEQLVRQTLLAS